MDQTNDDNKFISECEFLKTSVRLVLSVSVFSFFVWYSSGFSTLPHSFNAYFSTCLLSMLAHTLERKYMFLICNVILAFLAKTSLLTTSSPPISPYDLESSPSDTTKAPVSSEQVVFRFPENVSDFVVEEALEEQVSEAEAEGEEHGTLFTQTEGRENEAVEEEVEGKDDDDGDEEGETGSGVMYLTPTRDDALAHATTATNEELANTDELNRKFEEFIRKMKEEMRIEARRQPIAV